MPNLEDRLIIQTDASEEGLNANEQRAVERYASVRPHVVHETIVRQGEHELSRSNSALAWSGLAAGLSMGLSFIAQALLQAYLPDAPWRRLIVSFGYAFGFFAVILGRQQLFTENTLTAVLPLLKARNRGTLLQVLRLWTIVLIANLAGAHVVAWVCGNTPAFSSDVQRAFAELARQAADVTFGAAVLRGVIAGWIIALMVWMLAAMRTERFWIITFLTYLVSLGGLTHIVAGSIEVLFLVMAGAMPWTSFATGYMIPTFIGNVLGGVSLVSALNHAQVAADRGCQRVAR
jgi:formate/nitrite transporter FocA (FNT family)